MQIWNAATCGQESNGAPSWSDRNNEGYMIFQAGHMTTARIPSGSRVDPHSATAPSSGHHEIPSHQHIYREVQQRQTSESTHEKRTSFQKHLLKNQHFSKKTSGGTSETSKGTLLSMPSAIPLYQPPLYAKFFLALFFITDSYGKPITSNSPQWLPSDLCCRRLFWFFNKIKRLSSIP